MYYGEQRRAPHLGIKPTAADRKMVSLWSLMGVTVRQMCVNLGEHYKLGKPLSRLSLYNHFRNDMLRKKPGRRMLKKNMKKRVEENILSEMQRMILEAKARAKNPENRKP